MSTAVDFEKDSALNVEKQKCGNASGKTEIQLSAQVKESVASTGMAGDSQAISDYQYTDPSTGYKYRWNVEKKEWTLNNDQVATSQNVPIGEDSYIIEGDTYAYIDKLTGKKYLWDVKSNSWTESVKKRKKPTSGSEESESEEEENLDNEPKSNRRELNKQDMSKGHYSYEGDTALYTDPSDGTIYFWDKEKNAWFPKIDDTFMAYYQMNYGFVENTAKNEEVAENVCEKEETVKKEVEQLKGNDVPGGSNSGPQMKKKAPPPEPKWFEVDERHNTHVYVNNLPLDITEQEFVDLMQKCGLVMKDLETGRMKIKLYTEPDGQHLKGDALCTYIKKESVDLALQLLDGYEYRGKKIKVEKAHFTMKGTSYDPALKPKKKMKKRDKAKIKKMQEKLFDWRPDKMRGERAKHECVVVVKNFFDPKVFEDNLGLILEYRKDLMDECAKCGAVKRVVLHDKHPEGVAQVWFKEAEGADACVKLLNGRWFEQRQIEAFTWDGKTKYKVVETKEEAEARLKKWEKFISESKETAENSDSFENKEDYNRCENEEDSPNHEYNEKSKAYDSDNDSKGTRSSAGSDEDTDEEITQPKESPS